MTLAEYYENKRKGKIWNVHQAYADFLQQVKQQVSDGPTQKNCKILENYLNNLFYPKKINNQHKYFMSLLTSAYNKETDRVLSKKFNLNDITYKQSAVDVESTIKQLYEKTVKSNQIRLGDIENRLKKVNNLLRKVRTMKRVNQSSQSIESTLKDLIVLRKNIKSIIQSYVGQGSNAIININNNTDIVNLLNESAQAYQQYISPLEFEFTPNDWGLVLEYALNSVNFILDENVSYATGELIDKVRQVAGSTLIGSGSARGKKHRKTIQYNVNGVNYTQTHDINFNQVRQGKMDVFLQGSNNSRLKRDYRISAKNWLSADRNFGNTSIAAAIQRSLDNEVLNHFICIVGDDNQSENILTRAHQLAKLALVADILMGYSQKNNYVDTIVINLRNTNKPVKVYSLKSLFNNIGKQLNNIFTDDYNDTNVTNALRSLAMTNYDNYDAVAVHYLNQIRVALTYKDFLKLSTRSQ